MFFISRVIDMFFPQIFHEIYRSDISQRREKENEQFYKVT